MDPKIAIADAPGLRALFAAAVPATRGVAAGGLDAAGADVPGDADPVCVPGYRLLGELNRGAQGVVYRAVQEWSGREVAVKVLRDGPLDGPLDRARFRREVELAA